MLRNLINPLVDMVIHEGSRLVRVVASGGYRDENYATAKHLLGQAGNEPAGTTIEETGTNGLKTRIEIS